MTFDADAFYEKLHDMTAAILIAGEARLDTSFCAVCYGDATHGRILVRKKQLVVEYDLCGHQEVWGSL